MSLSAGAGGGEGLLLLLLLEEAGGAAMVRQVVWRRRRSDRSDKDGRRQGIPAALLALLMLPVVVLREGTRGWGNQSGVTAWNTAIYSDERSNNGARFSLPPSFVTSPHPHTHTPHPHPAQTQAHPAGPRRSLNQKERGAQEPSEAKGQASLPSRTPPSQGLLLFVPEVHHHNPRDRHGQPRSHRL